MVKVKMPIMAFCMCAFSILAGATFERATRPELPNIDNFAVEQVQLAHEIHSNCMEGM